MRPGIRIMQAVAAGFVLAAPLAAAAQPAPAAMPGMPMPHDHGAAPGQQDMMQSMERMNRAMTAAPMTGDPDRDFVVMMMPHHQGAIDMARIYLRTGKDPAIRRMAQRIIVDQEREIRDFKAWLARRPAPAR